MSDETPAILSDPLSQSTSSQLALGAALRTARERLGLEVEQVAQQLRMSVHQIKALEDDNLIALSSPAFVRGFIRNYARLLKIAPEPLIAAYKAMQPDESPSLSISLHSENIKIVNASRRTMLVYLVASVLVILGGIAWWFYQDWHELAPKSVTQDTKPVKEVTLPAPASPVATPAASTPPIVTVSPVTVPAPTSSVAAPAAPIPQNVIVSQPVTGLAQANPAAAKPAKVAVTPATLASAPVVVSTTPVTSSTTGVRMTFSEQTWVSITDITGKEVFNKTKPADTEDTADGVPPYKVVVGNALGVQVFYKGKPFDIYPYTKANVAHFTLE